MGVMPLNVNNVIKAIVTLNNRYRDPGATVRAKLEALWEMGDQLHRMGVTSPHSVGWEVQRETRGLIKRPTVFRSHKLRTIWTSKEALIKDVGRLRALSNLTEILPLIDPGQEVRHKLTSKELGELYHHACSDLPADFRQYIGGLKKRFANGKLGKPLDRSKHLYDLHLVITDTKTLQEYLIKIIHDQDSAAREVFRTGTSADEIRAFSNMCIALTTKDNYALYQRLRPGDSSSQNQEFRSLYGRFRELPDQKTDVSRARLRRLISPDALAQISDTVSSLASEAGVADFKARQKLTINL